MVFVKRHVFCCELFCQVVRVMLLWVNNHFRDFEMLPDMTDILEKFSSLLEEKVCTYCFNMHVPGEPGFVAGCPKDFCTFYRYNILMYYICQN